MTTAVKAQGTVDVPVGRPAVLCVDTFAGRRENQCMVIGETPMKYRIVVDSETRLPSQVLMPGERALVPRWSVRFLSPNSELSGPRPLAAEGSRSNDGLEGKEAI